MAFRRLQEKLVFAPILVFPDSTKTFLLDSNVSNEGIGAVLSQVEDGQETVIVYASQVLSKAERGYCVTRRELLAVVTFLQQFRVYAWQWDCTVKPVPAVPPERHQHQRGKHHCKPSSLVTPWR